MIRFISSLFFCFLFTVCCNGQDTTVSKKPYAKDVSLHEYMGKDPWPRMNTFFVEIFGNGANLYTLNYERCIFINERKLDIWDRYSLRVGVNYFLEKFSLPVMFHFSTGEDKCFEAGAGWVPWLSSKKRVDGVAAFAGFKYQPDRAGIMARFALTPTYLVQEKEHWRMIFGFSFGWTY